MKIDIFTKAMGCQKLTYQNFSFLEVIHPKKRVSAEKKRLKDYVGNYVYVKVGTGPNELQFFNTPEGYVSPVNAADYNSGFNYIYQYKDHLGNIRLSYSDNDNSGSITTSEIIEEHNYYPFGLKQKGYNNNVNGTHHKYMFGGKELSQELGLETYDFGARNYDAALGRWMNLDPLAEQMRRHSPYNYAFNNPIYFIDPDGMAPEDWIKNLKTGVVKWYDAKGDDAIAMAAVENGDLSPVEQLTESVKGEYKNLGESFFGTKGENVFDNEQIKTQQDEYLTEVSSDLNQKAGVDYESDELGGGMNGDVTKDSLKSYFMGSNNGGNSAKDSEIGSFVKGEIKNELIETGLEKGLSISSNAAGVVTAVMSSTKLGDGTRQPHTKRNAVNAFQSKVKPLLDMKTIINISLHKY